MERTISILGLLAFPGIAWLLSPRKRLVNWRLLGWGLGLQLCFAYAIFRLEWGRRVFGWVNAGMNGLVSAGMEGANFVFGGLSSGQGARPLGFILAFQGLPLIIVFSALIAILYHLGVMQVLIRIFARLFSRLLGVSGAESLCSASNIFVGIESTLAVRPHILKMTKSELCTILTVSMATVASNVMGVYILALGGRWPDIAAHLVSASILSAPAALIMAKLILPETEIPETLGTDIHPHYEREDNIFSAVVVASENGLKLVFGIAALLIAVVGLLAIANAALGAVFPGHTIQGAIAYLFYPLAWLMGVPTTSSCGNEAWSVAVLLSERLIVTEVNAYFHLSAMIGEGRLSPRSVTTVTYALCGFAHIPSIAIFVGGIAAIVPERKNDLTRVAWRALVAATLACLMTGAVAGLLSTESPTILQGH